MESADLTQRNIEKIAELFPNVITETKDEQGNIKKAVNFDALKLQLSREIANEKEMYEFTWPGKKESLASAYTPTNKTLRPYVQEGVSWDKTNNILIEGDNLPVLKLLQESYLNEVKMIFIDPPYNSGNDFIYTNDFKSSREEYEKASGVIDDNGKRMIRNSISSGSFHSDWCSMIYPRLVLARNLLSMDGVIFISIDEEEVGNLRKICDEVFGAPNFISDFIWQSRASISNDYEVSLNHNHILVYAKKRDEVIFGGDAINQKEYDNPDNDPRGPWKLVPLDANHAGGNTVYPIRNPNTGVDYYPPNGRIWCYNKNTMSQLMNDGLIKFGKNDKSAPKRKLFLQERIDKGDSKTPSSLLLDVGTTKDGTTELMKMFNGLKVFDYPKPTSLIKRLIQYGAPNGGIILDFFAGSGTTGQAVFELQKEMDHEYSFILVQAPEPLVDKLKTIDKKASVTINNAINYLKDINKPLVLSEITKERLRKTSIDPNSVDLGFRVLKLDSSNMKDVYFSPHEYSQNQLFEYELNIKEDRSDLDLLFACLLEWGLKITNPLTSEEILGVKIQSYDSDSLITCFADDVPEEVIREIANRHPLRAVFRNSSFVDDSSRVNVDEIFKLLSPDTEVKVL